MSTSIPCGRMLPRTGSAGWAGAWRGSLVALVMALVAGVSIPLPLPAGANVTGLVDCRFSKAQVFDVQWNISGVAPDRTLNVSGLTGPFASADPAGPVDSIADTDTFAFYVEGSDVGFRQFGADGSLKRTLHTEGTFQALGPDFIFYLGAGFFGTLITSGEGFAYGESATLAVTDENVAINDALGYSTCSATPLAIGEKRGDVPDPGTGPDPEPSVPPAPQPQPDPGGGLPVTSPGSSSGSAGGVVVMPAASQPGAGSAEFAVGAMTARLDMVVGGAGGVSGPASAPVLSVTRDGAAGVSGGGMRPGGVTEVWLVLPSGGSRQLALLPVGGDGTFGGVLPFTGELDGQGPLPIGPRTLQMFGIGADGQLTVINVGVNILQRGPFAPEAQRVSGMPPTLGRGESLATNAGLPTAVTATPLPGSRSTRIQGDGWLMDVDVPDGRVTDESGAPLIEVALGDRAVVRGNGFMPGTRAYVWIMSDPAFLGEVTVGANGSFNGTVPVVGVEPGQHTLQLSGVGTDGYVRAANLGVVVTGDGAPRPNRVNTGGGPAPLIPLPGALLLLTAMAGVLVAGQSRTRLTPTTVRRRAADSGFDAIDARLAALRDRLDR